MVYFGSLLELLEKRCEIKGGNGLRVRSSQSVVLLQVNTDFAKLGVVENVATEILADVSVFIVCGGPKRIVNYRVIGPKNQAIIVLDEMAVNLCLEEDGILMRRTNDLLPCLLVLFYLWWLGRQNL